jgi:integrase
LRRDELSADGALWILAGARTKNHQAHRLPLSRLAQEIIAQTPTIGDAGYLFTTTGVTPVSGFSKMKARLDAAMLRIARAEQPDVVIPPWRLHDLRSTAATALARLRTPIHVTERTLNHVSGSLGGLVGVYQKYDFQDKMKAALEAYARWLAALIDRSAGSNVVQLPKRR